MSEMRLLPLPASLGGGIRGVFRGGNYLWDFTKLKMGKIKNLIIGAVLCNKSKNFGEHRHSISRAIQLLCHLCFLEFNSKMLSLYDSPEQFCFI